MKALAVLLLLVGLILIILGVFSSRDPEPVPQPSPMLTPTPSPINSGCVKADSDILTRYIPVTSKMTGEIVNWRPVSYDTPIPAGHYGMIVDLSRPTETQGTRREFYQIVWASEDDPYLAQNPMRSRNKHWILTDLVSPADCHSIPGPTPTPSPSPTPTPTPPEIQLRSLTELQVTIQSFKFFEGGEETPAPDQRVFATRFSRSPNRFLYWALTLNHPSRGSREYFSFEEVLFNPAGVSLGNNKWTSYIDPTWTASVHTSRLVSLQPGTLQAGTYKVGVYIGGVEVTIGEVEIVPD